MGTSRFSVELEAIWRQEKIPVVFKREKPLPILVKTPYAKDNSKWLRINQSRKPQWNEKFKAWEIPQAWFEKVVAISLRRYGKVYVIQLYREMEKCASPCWNAKGFHCECSCMGEHHGGDHPDG